MKTTESGKENWDAIRFSFLSPPEDTFTDFRERKSIDAREKHQLVASSTWPRPGN